MSATTRPLFLVGTGRCGSTIIYSSLAVHPDFSWIPSWLTIAPRLPVIAAVNRLWELPGADRFRDTRFFPKPVEPNPVFEAWDPSFRREELSAEDMRRAVDSLGRLVPRITRAHGNPRFLCKMVGRPVKVELLDAAFPDAHFLHITRSLKPTTASLLQVEFYHGVDLTNWPWDPIPEVFRNFAASRGNPEEVKAAIVVRTNHEDVRRQLARIPAGRVLTMAYSEFIDDPETSLAKIGRFAGFRVEGRFLARVRRRIYKGADDKWRTYFSPEQQRHLDDFESIET
jgi:hypothetical protein